MTYIPKIYVHPAFQLTWHIDLQVPWKKWWMICFKEVIAYLVERRFFSVHYVCVCVYSRSY